MLKNAMFAAGDLYVNKQSYSLIQNIVVEANKIKNDTSEHNIVMKYNTKMMFIQ